MAPISGVRRRRYAVETAVHSATSAIRASTTALDPAARRSALLIVLGIATVVARMHELLGPLRQVRPILLVVVLVTIATFSVRRRLRVTSSIIADRSLLTIYAYWAWMMVTIPTSIYKSQSVKVALDMAMVIIFATMLAAQPPSAAQIRTITRGFFAVVAAFGMYLLLFGYAVVDVDGLRYAITASLDPNDCAALLAIGAPMALAEARRPGRVTWRLFCWAAFVIICLATLRTASRGGAIALVVGVALVFLSGRGVRVLMTSLVLGIVLLFGRQFVPEGLLPKRLATIGNLSDDYNMNVYGGRVQIWKRGLTYFAADPIFGVGVGNFAVREGQQMAEDGVPGHWSAPHNAYLQAFVELGFIGGVLFCSAIIVSVRRVASIFRRASPVTGTAHPEYLASVMAFSSSAVFLSHAYFWGFFALVALCSLAAQSLVPRAQYRS